MVLLHLVVIDRLFFLSFSIALQSGCLLLYVTCHCLIGSLGVHLGFVVLLFSVICGTDAELPLCLFYRICCSAGHPVGQLFSQFFTEGRPTHHNLAMHPFTLVCLRCRTSQYWRTFILACVSLWNMLDESDFAGDSLGAFKTPVNHTLRGTGYLTFLSSGLTFIFCLSSLSFFTLFYHLYLSLSFLSPLIFLWVCNGVGVFALVGSGLYSRPCLLLLGGVLVGKSPTLFQFRVSLSG